MGPIVDGIPTTIDGRPVLLLPDAIDALVASRSDEPVLVGGWFHVPAPVWWCPAQGYDAPWGTCLRFAIYEQATGGIGDIVGTPVWLYGKPPADTILVYPGDALGSDQVQPYAATRPVVLTVHTHDATCPAGLMILGQSCTGQAVLDHVVWLGDPVR